MTKTRKHTNFLALLLSLVMAFSLLPSPAFAAEADYYQKATSLENGGKYVIAVKSGDDWYAVTGEANRADQTVVSKATKVTVEDKGNMVVDPEALTVWTYSSSSKQLSNDYGALYFSSEGLKYQSQGYRGVTFENDNLYAHSTDGTTSGKDIYLAFSGPDASKPFATVVSDTNGVVSGEATVVIFKKLSEDEEDAYEQRKAEEEEQEKIDAAKAIAIGALDQMLTDDYLKDYSEANQAIIREKVEAARGPIQAATSVDDVTAAYGTLWDEIKLIPTKKQEEQAAVEAEKTAANTKLDAFVAEDNLSKYSEANQTKIREAVDACRTQIETAATVDAVKDLVASLETEIAAVPTKQQEEEQAEQKAVEDAKTAANAELDAFVTAENLAKYDDANQAKIKDAVASYRTQIETAATVDAVNALVAAAKEEIKAIPEKKDDSGKDPEKADDVKTAKDTAAKELEAAKAAAGFDAEQKAQIQNIIKIYTTKIQAATTAEQVKTLVAQFNKEVKALPTAAQKQAIKKIAVKSKSVKAGKKKMTVKWKAKKTKFDGYQIKYKVKGKKKWKTATAKKASAAKKVVKKLKKGKKYKVKVRGYKLFGVNKDVKVYGKYSKTKTSKKIK